MKNKLATRELLLFMPEDALAIPGSTNICFRRNAKHSVEVDITGRVGHSDLTGYPIIEEMTIYLGREDITNSVPERILQDLEANILEEYGIKDVPVKV